MRPASFLSGVDATSGSAACAIAHDPQLVEAFATKVARPRGKALIIDEENDGHGWIPIEEASRSRRAFAVDVAEDLLAGDCDEPELAPEVVRVAGELVSEGYSPVLVNSGRPGHLHLFCRIDTANLLERYRVHARAAGLDVRRTIRPPLSPHRLGLPVGLAAPCDPGEALAALTPRSEFRPLSPRMAALLRDGDRQGRYEGTGKRSSVVMAIVTGMVNAGWNVEKAFLALRDPQNLGGEKIQERDEDAAWRYVAACWDKAQAKVDLHPPIRDREAAVAEICRVRAVVEAYAWKGATGTTDRRVMEAHLAIATRSGKLVYGAGVRSIAELAGCGLEAVVNAHRRLRDQRWLKLVTEARWREGKATIWTLRGPAMGVTKSNSLIRTRPEAGTTNPNSQIPPRGGDERDCTVSDPPGAGLAGDVWRRGAFGGNAWRIWRVLATSRSQRSRDIACRLGLNPQVVRRHLARLETHGLAVRDQQWRWGRGPAKPEEVAVKLGTAGTGERQRRDHQHDRERYREQLAQRKTSLRL